MTTVLAMDLGGTQVKFGVLENGEPTKITKLPAPRNAAELADIATAGRKLISRHPEVSAVGIAAPAVIDPATSTLTAVHGKYDYAIGLDLADWARQEFGVPAVAENDARAALLGELAALPVQPRNAAIMITGTGIGTAALTDGELLIGPDGHAGVLGGHLTVELDGPACNCNNIGCAEAIGGSWNLGALARSTPGWSDSALAAAGDQLTMAVLFEATERGDAVARRLTRRVLAAWQATAVNLCHAYQPQVLIFSGGPMLAAAAHHDQLRAAVRQRLWSSLPRPELIFASEPQHSVVRGLAVLAERTVKGNR